MALKTAHLAALTKVYDDFIARQKDPKAELDRSRIDQLGKTIEKLWTETRPAGERDAGRRLPDD